MKKLLGILLGVCVAAPAMAAGVSDINRGAWLHHMKEMQILRKQIVKAISNPERTAEEQAALDSLNEEFAAKQANWDAYIKAVAEDDAEGREKVESKFEHNRKPAFHKHHKHNDEACGEHKKHKHHKRHFRPRRHHRHHRNENNCRQNCEKKCEQKCVKNCKKECCNK